MIVYCNCAVYVPLTAVQCGGHVSGTVAGLMKRHPSSFTDDTLDYMHIRRARRKHTMMWASVAGDVKIKTSHAVFLDAYVQLGML